MKAMLEFELPAEQNDLDKALKAQQYSSAIETFRQTLRTWEKTDNNYPSLEVVKQEFFEVFEGLLDP